MNTPPLICLITAGHVASTPRLVKTADALVEAGFGVHVLAGAPYPPADRLDDEILATSNWKYARVARGKSAVNLQRRMSRALARRLISIRAFATPGLAALAQASPSPGLASAAARIPADLYLGHGLSALAAAARAARARKAKFGFDIEDYHDAETEESMADSSEMRARQVLQSKLLPHARPLTCASPLIAEKYAETYRVDPLVVLNVFPLSQAPRIQPVAEPISERRPARLYWFSQTIGPGRGLEEVIAAMGMMRTPVEMQLRGFVAHDYRAFLQTKAMDAGLKRPLLFVPPGPPNEMARMAATADMGLSVEEPKPLNRDICLTNKIFVYLLAGIPQLLSKTSAQTRLAAELGEAALVSDIAQAAATAEKLDLFFIAPAKIAQARSRAWDMARGRFCWDFEKEIVVNAVRSALNRPA
jgi:Glycosyl transferase 4-like domain